MSSQTLPLKLFVWELHIAPISEINVIYVGDSYWKLTEDSIAPGYPRLVSQDWTGLPGILILHIFILDTLDLFLKTGLDFQVYSSFIYSSWYLSSYSSFIYSLRCLSFHYSSFIYAFWYSSLIYLFIYSLFQIKSIILMFFYIFVYIFIHLHIYLIIILSCNYSDIHPAFHVFI